MYGDARDTLGPILSQLGEIERRLSRLEGTDGVARGNVAFTGTVGLKRTNIASDYAVQSGDCYIAVTSTAAPRTITLPTDWSAGKILIIKDESGGAGTNTITVSGNGKLIDGSATRAINTNYGVLRLISSGAAWFTW
jgi:hypothetical protein